MATAFPNVRRSGGRCSSIQEKAAGETGKSRKTEEWFSQRKSTVGELPEATNESLCEDIMPPSAERCPRKCWGRTKVGFAPYRPYPFFRRLAPWPFLWLGCWSANGTPSLETHKRVPHWGECGPESSTGITGTEKTARIGRGPARVRRTSQAGL